jgi:chemotaxis protein methyltransferase CheR
VTSANDYQLFVQGLKQILRIDLNFYKEKQMKRRLTSLRDKLGYTDFQSFLADLRHSSALQDVVLKRITINVTEFYRNPEQWNTLRTTILSRIYPENKRLVCWSSACSTGEEPYTLAMVLEEAGVRQYEILATDIDPFVLERAKEAVYPAQAIRNLPPEKRQTYFTQKGETYLLRKEQFRGKIFFRKLDLLHDLFPREFHLILCRNVVIYFTDEAKDRLYRKLSDALVPKGILFVGSTEQIFHPHQYGLHSVAPFFYQKQDVHT